MFALAQATNAVSVFAAKISKHGEALDAVLNKLGEDGAKAEELRGMLAAAAEKEERMALILEEMKVKIAEGASAAQAAAAAAVAAAVGGGAAMAPEAVAELHKELLEGVAPAMLDALEKEGALTREAVALAKEEILGKVADMGDKIEEVGRLWCCNVMEKPRLHVLVEKLLFVFTDLACACRSAVTFIVF